MPAGKHEGSVPGHSVSCTMLRLRGQMSHSPAELHVASCRLSKEKWKVHPIEPSSVLQAARSWWHTWQQAAGYPCQKPHSMGREC